MAGPDPRRSSRARAPQSQSQQSSTTSSSSGRAERNTRSFNKTGSPQKSASTASLSSEPPDDSITTADDILVRSRRTRAKDEDHEQTSTIADEIEMAHGDDLQDDDEAVRCVCGQDEYPGPPSLDDLKHAAKDGYNLDSIYPTEITEDLAGFYVQCDICKVWQHGACVGLTNDDTLPEEYYCEQCRSDHHKVFTSSNGTKFSIYVPLKQPSRAPSLAKEGTRSPKSREGKNTRLSAAAQSSKRRSTMNSRDAAYDEEQLRMAIEASRGEAVVDPPEPGTRRAKRGRSDSEENPENPKRPRTSSRSASPTVEKQLEGDESDDALPTRNGSSKKARNAATRNLREKAEKEERERQRAEAASKRKGRAERRRADDSDPLEDAPLAARAVTARTTAISETIPPPEAPPSSQPTPDTPPATAVVANNSRSKGGRPTHKKKGRNQYTKDRDGREEESPARSQSRDVQEAGHIAGSKSAPETTKASAKSRGGMNSKVTLAEMRRRATAMFDYISKTQVELAGETAAAALDSRRSSKENTLPGSLPVITVNGDSAKNGDSSTMKPPDEKNSASTQNGDTTDAAKEFKDLSCVEMMDFLTRDLVHWQNQFSG